MGKINWFSIVKGRKTSLFRTLSIAYGTHKNMRKILGGTINNVLVVGRKMAVDWYLDKDEMENLGKIVLLQMNKNPEFAQVHFREFQRRFRFLIDFSQKIKSLENVQLGQLFPRFVEAYWSLTPFMTTPHIFQLVLEREVKELIKRKKAKEKLFLDLAIPHQEVFETTQQRELLELAAVIAQKKKLAKIFIKEEPEVILRRLKNFFPRIYSLFKSYEQKWAWVGMEDWMYEPYKRARLIEILGETLKTYKKPQKILLELEKNQKKIYQKAKMAIRKVNPTKSEQILIFLLQKYIWLRTARLEAFRKAFYYTKPLILKIAKKAHLSQNEVYSLTPQEIITFLGKNKLPNRKIIQKRIKGCVFLIVKGKAKLYSGENWPDKVERKFGLGARTTQRIIKGQPACLGKAKGRVKIILSKKEIEKVTKGDVLVTTMTNPDYVIAMRKAVAIVTDEGGVTCHAAIVSRELSIPCVIGTQIATKVLKDGDLVEVDAKKGIVRKIGK